MKGPGVRGHLGLRAGPALEQRTEQGQLHPPGEGLGDPGGLCRCFLSAVKHGLVSRRCGPDGQWVTVNGSQPWRDYSQCEDELEVTAEEVRPCLGPQGWLGQPGRGWTRTHLGSPAAVLTCAGRRPPAHGQLQGALHRGVLAVTAHPHLRPAGPHRLQVGHGPALSPSPLCLPRLTPAPAGTCAAPGITSTPTCSPPSGCGPPR